MVLVTFERADEGFRKNEGREERWIGSKSRRRLQRMDHKSLRTISRFVAVPLKSPEIKFPPVFSLFLQTKPDRWLIKLCAPVKDLNREWNAKSSGGGLPVYLPQKIRNNLLRILDRK